MLGRPHIHLPITKGNGDLLLFADVTLLDPDTGTQVSPKVYDGPQDTATELSWPVTFAPANVDLWIDEPGRYDLRVVGPDGYSAVVRGVDFAPAVANQVTQPVGTKITNAPLARRWLQGDSAAEARFKDPGLIGPHDHDGVEANSTKVGEGLHSNDSVTEVGYTAEAASAGTVVGYWATASGDGTTVGQNSEAYNGGTTVGDNHGHGTMPAGQTTLTQDSDLTETAYTKPNEVHARSMSTAAGSDNLGSLAAPAAPSGVTHPVWIRGQAVIQNLIAPNDAVLGAADGTVGFYGADGAAQGAQITGATGALADLVAALEAYGLLDDGAGTPPTEETVDVPIAAPLLGLDYPVYRTGAETPYVPQYYSSVTYTWHGTAPYVDTEDAEANYGEIVRTTGGANTTLGARLEPYTPPAGKVVVDAELTMQYRISAVSGTPILKVMPYLERNPDTGGDWSQYAGNNFPPPSLDAWHTVTLGAGLSTNDQSTNPCLYWTDVADSHDASLASLVAALGPDPNSGGQGCWATMYVSNADYSSTYRMDLSFVRLRLTLADA